MQAVLFGLVAAVCFGGVFVALRWAYRVTGVASTQAAVISVVAAATTVTLVAVAIGAFALVEPASAAPYVLAGLLAPGLSHLAMYRSIDHFGGTRTAVVLGFVPVLAAVGAWLVLAEAPGWMVAVGAIAVVAAAVLIVDRRAGATTPAGPAFALTAVVCFAGRDVVIRGAEQGLGPFAASSVALLAAAVFLVTVNLSGFRTEIAAAIRNHLPPLLVPGFLMAVGYTSLVAGFSVGRVAVVSTIAATQSVWAVIFARFFLDRSEWSRRVVVASLLATVGGVVVALGAT